MDLKFTQNCALATIQSAKISIVLLLIILVLINALNNFYTEKYECIKNGDYCFIGVYEANYKDKSGGRL